MHTAAAKGNREAESDAESKRREPIFSPASAMQTAAKLKSRSEGNRGTHIPSPASEMQTARQEDTRQLKSMDSERRAEIPSPAFITSGATLGFKATALATTTLPESKHTGLAPAAFSMTAAEESTALAPAAFSMTAVEESTGLAPAAFSMTAAEESTGLTPAAFSMTAAEESTQGNLSTMQLASGGNDHACLDTAATSIAAAEEIGQVASVTTTEAAGNDSTEQDSLCCSEMTENSTAVDNPVNLIPISLDTVVVVISPATGETGIEGCMDATENFPAADNSLERVFAAEYSAENSATASSSGAGRTKPAST